MSETCKMRGDLAGQAPLLDTEALGDGLLDDDGPRSRLAGCRLRRAATTTSTLCICPCGPAVESAFGGCRFVVGAVVYGVSDRVAERRRRLELSWQATFVVCLLTIGASPRGLGAFGLL